MDDATLWWIAAGLLVAAELCTGSIYLLMLALGATAGAIAAHLGLGNTAELVIAALTGCLTTLGWYAYRRHRASRAPSVHADRSVILDIGETVQVADWDAQGQTRVQYRGASWSARYVGAQPRHPGPHRIAALHGNQLELDSL